jgi:hypothetical protein
MKQKKQFDLRKLLKSLTLGHWIFIILFSLMVNASGFVRDYFHQQQQDNHSHVQAK